MTPLRQYFSGRIDDVRIYNRALTQTQIQTDMATPIGGAAPPDTQPPTAPTGLTATASSPTQVGLSWTGHRQRGGRPVPDRALPGAGCFRFTEIATVTGTTYTDTGRSPSTAYSYRVRAQDAALNLGPLLDHRLGDHTRPPTRQPPTAPTGLTATASSPTQVGLSWSAATDNVGVAQYRIERCQGAGCSVFSEIATATGTTYYRLGALALHGLLVPGAGPGRRPQPGAVLDHGLGDHTRPGRHPAPDRAHRSDRDRVEPDPGRSVLERATDNVGVVQYRIERCQGAGCFVFTEIATVTGTTYSDTGRSPSTAYSYRVRAQDAALNLGPYSTTASATTPAASTGLVAAYSFNEGAGTSVADASGSGNGGLDREPRPGRPRQVRQRAPRSTARARVTVPDSPSLRLTTGMTLEAWVFPTTVNAAWRDVIYKGNDDYYLEATSSNGRPVGGGTFGGNNGEAYGTANLAANTWTHLAVTYDGTTLRFYVNGTQVSSNARSGAIATSSGALSIGGDASTGSTSPVASTTYASTT